MNHPYRGAIYISSPENYLAASPLFQNGFPSELRIFNRTTSSAFFSHLKTTFFDRAGVGSASE